MRDRNGVYQLIEINPRFPAWIYISAGVGRNLPLALLQLALGLELSPFEDIRTGMLFIRYAQETITTMQDFESIIMRNTHQFSN